MEALLRADRFFGVSLLLLQQTQTSFLAAFILAGSDVATFELFTEEWSRHPLRVQAAQEARHLAGIAGGCASAAASAGHAATLGVHSRVTGLLDGMGMNIAGRAQKLKEDAAKLGISADDKVQADRGLAGVFRARASDGRVATLGVRSRVTGLPDGMGMKIAGGAQKLKQDAHNVGISADDKAQADRSTAASFGGRALAGRTTPMATTSSALATRGVRNPNVSFNAQHPDDIALGAEIGEVVMGPLAWQNYITTSTTKMVQVDKPLNQKESATLAAARPSRKGWVFYHVTRTTERWVMQDRIAFTLPGHTEENPVLYVESLREAISEAYHVNWVRYSAAKLKDRKDKNAGTKLSRSKKH